MTPKPTASAFAAAQHLQKIKADAEQAMMDKVQKIDVRQLVLHASGQASMTFMEPTERFDECIIGTAEVNGEIVAILL